MLEDKTYEQVTCLLCGDSETKLLADTGQFGWPTYVSICTNCGLVFLNPRWKREDYLHFYAHEYDDYFRFDEEQAREKEVRKAKTVWERLNRFTKAEFRQMLDIGSGLGYLLGYFREQREGLEIHGIEPSTQGSERLTNEIGGNLLARDVDTDWHISHPEAFDLIVFRHVLEHMLDPVAALKKAVHALAPGGVVYVAVPDMLHPDGSLSDFWYRCVHTYYFSKPTLTRVAALAGLEPVAIREQEYELWGIFRKADGAAQPGVDSVYAAQMSVLRQYRARRLVRRTLRMLKPRKLSQFIPKSIKNLVPHELKEKFRELVYRN